MKLKAIADKKMILADLQSALNDTFDEFEIKGNDFISKDNIVNDPERSMNNMAKSGIEIKPENKGKFTAWAKEKGMSVSAAANKVMANTDGYSPGVVKMANFAKNFAKNGAGVPKAQGGVEVEDYAPFASKQAYEEYWTKNGGIPNEKKKAEPKVEKPWENTGSNYNEIFKEATRLLIEEKKKENKKNLSPEVAKMN